jgi:hypothetical protein
MLTTFHASVRLSSSFVLHTGRAGVGFPLVGRFFLLRGRWGNRRLLFFLLFVGLVPLLMRLLVGVGLGLLLREPVLGSMLDDFIHSFIRQSAKHDVWA